MMAEQPIRKHVNISARDSAQLELRLHWFARALAERQGYIVALLRRANASGRHVATVSYELQLPQFSSAERARRGRTGVRQAPGPRRAGERGSARAQGASSGIV